MEELVGGSTSSTWDPRGEGLGAVRSPSSPASSPCGSQWLGAKCYCNPPSSTRRAGHSPVQWVRPPIFQWHLGQCPLHGVEEGCVEARVTSGFYTHPHPPVSEGSLCLLCAPHDTEVVPSSTDEPPDETSGVHKDFSGAWRGGNTLAAFPLGHVGLYMAVRPQLSAGKGDGLLGIRQGQQAAGRRHLDGLAHLPAQLTWSFLLPPVLERGRRSR